MSRIYGPQRNAFYKTQQEELDYGIDFSGVLSDPVDAATWDVPAGLTSLGQSISGSVASIVLGGGTEGERYEIVCRARTAAGLEAERSIFVTIVTPAERST